MLLGSNHPIYDWSWKRDFNMVFVTLGCFRGFESFYLSHKLILQHHYSLSHRSNSKHSRFLTVLHQISASKAALASDQDSPLSSSRRTFQTIIINRSFKISFSRLCDVWSGSDGWIFKPLLWHLCRDCWIWCCTRRRTERISLRQDTRCRDLR